MLFRSSTRMARLKEMQSERKRDRIPEEDRMQIDAARLAPDELQKLRDEKRCFKCRRKGHFSKDCRVKTDKSAKARQARKEDSSDDEEEQTAKARKAKKKARKAKTQDSEDSESEDEGSSEVLGRIAKFSRKEKDRLLDGILGDKDF